VTHCHRSHCSAAACAIDAYTGRGCSFAQGSRKPPSCNAATRSCRRSALLRCCCGDLPGAPTLPEPRAPAPPAAPAEERLLLAACSSGCCPGPCCATQSASEPRWCRGAGRCTLTAPGGAADGVLILRLPLLSEPGFESNGCLGGPAAEAAAADAVGGSAAAAAATAAASKRRCRSASAVSAGGRPSAASAATSARIRLARRRSPAAAAPGADAAKTAASAAWLPDSGGASAACDLHDETLPQRW